MGAPRTKDWVGIKAEYMAGAKKSVLSRKYDVSRQAIDFMETKENWTLSPEALPGQDPATAEIAHANVKDIMNDLSDFGKKTEYNQDLIYQYIRAGQPIKAAASHVGISMTTINKWRREDEKFDAILKLGASEFIQASLSTMNRAVARGDVRAAMWNLENNPHSKEYFGKDQSKGKSDIKIELSFSRNALTNYEDAIVLEPNVVEANIQEDIKSSDESNLQEIEERSNDPVVILNDNISEESEIVAETQGRLKVDSRWTQGRLKVDSRWKNDL